MNNLEALKSVSNYPVPQRTLDRVAAGRGIILEDETTASLLASDPYRYAEADVMMWLAAAPNISEGGISFSFSQSERDQFVKEASGIYAELGTPKGTIYGYKGENL